MGGWLCLRGRELSPGASGHSERGAGETEETDGEEERSLVITTGTTWERGASEDEGSSFEEGELETF